MSLELPNFRDTDHAVRFGQFMTRDQFVLITGGRDALQREFDRMDLIYKERNQPDQVLLQILSDLATTIQKMRESLEAAPDLVLASMIGGDRCANGFEKIEVGHL